MARKLCEQYRRRADFDATYCTPIVLCNGEEWQFQRPWLEIIPRFDGRAVVGHDRMLTCGELDPLIVAIGKLEPGIDQAMAILSLGALILVRSYDLTDAELSRLFILRPGSPDSDRLLREIIEVATGHTLQAIGPRAVADPKARAPGSGPLSSRLERQRNGFPWTTRPTRP
jgi:hypothetical protein